MQVELTGRIVNVLPEQRFNGRNGEVVKNAFVIEWQVGADKFEKMKQSVAVGNTVQCKFSVSSREWNGKYFTSCQCFYCVNVGGQQQAQQTTQAPQQPANAPQQSNIDDQLPF